MSGEPYPGAAIDTVGGILRRGDAILLGLRSPHRRSCPGCWDIVGGHVEAGETPMAALVRELGEEIGVAAGRLTWLRDLDYRDAPGDRSLRLRLFLVDSWAGEATVANDEHSELRWFPIADATRLSALALDEYRPVFAALARDDRAGDETTRR